MHQKLPCLKQEVTDGKLLINGHLQTSQLWIIIWGKIAGSRFRKIMPAAVFQSISVIQINQSLIQMGSFVEEIMNIWSKTSASWQTDPTCWYLKLIRLLTISQLQGQSSLICL